MFEAYSVAVKLTLLENVTAGLMKMSSYFTKAHADAELLQTKLNKLKMPALIGAGATAAGVAGLGLLKGPIEEANKYQNQLLKFESLGFGDHVNRQADKLATGMKTIGTSATENMELLGDAMAVFKNIGEASMAAPIMAQMKYANKIMYGDQGGARDSKLMDMLKVGELRGGTASAEAMQRQAEFAQKVIEGSRNRVDPTAMLQAMKYGGIATRMMSDRAFYLRSEPLIQEVGGSGFGTGMAALYSNLAQGRGSLTAQQELYRLGMMDKHKVKFNSMGMLKKALPGAFKAESAFKDGVEGVGTALLTAFAAHGITKDDDVIRELGLVASNQRGARLLTTWYQQRRKISEQADANEHALGLSDAVKKSSETYEGRKEILQAKWENFQLALGKDGGVLDLATRGLDVFAKVINRVTEFAKNHPTLTKFAVGGFAIASAFIALAGALTVLSVGMSAMRIAMGAGALSGGLGMLMRGLGTGIMFFARALLLNPIGLAVTGIALALYGLYHYWDKIKSWLPKWMTGGDSALPSKAPGSSEYVRTSANSQPFHIENKIDWHGISSRVTQWQGDQSQRPQHGTSDYDGKMGAYTPTLAAAGG